MQDHYRMMAGYNAWANRRLFEAAARLPDAALGQDAGAFFGSLLGTLNHMLVADRIWMRRLAGAGEAPDRLDAILHERLADLAAAREAEDARIVAFVDGLSEEDLSGTLAYRTIADPAEVRQTLASALAHFFNHQAHHRGQAHALLTRFAGEAPSLDLLVYQRQTGIGLVPG